MRVKSVAAATDTNLMWSDVQRWFLEFRQGLSALLGPVGNFFSQQPRWVALSTVIVLVLLVYWLLLPTLQIWAINRSTRRRKSSKHKPRWYYFKSQKGLVACLHCYSPYRPKPHNRACPTCGREP